MEEVSALAKTQPEFGNALEFVREGDIFVITTISRFGRPLKNILDKVSKLKEKKVSFRY